MLALEVSNVTVRYGGVEALHRVSLSVSEGERHVVLGPNGAGKTTLFNLILGEVRPAAGVVRLRGEDVTRRSVVQRVRRGLGRTYQQPEVLARLRVEDNLILAVRGRLGPRFTTFSQREHDGDTRKRALAALNAVGLGGVAEHRAHELAHGQAKQLEIAMALAGGARVILLDEPASGLSAGERKQITAVIDGLDRSVTVIVIEHDMDVAFHIADRLTVLHQGRVLACGDPERVRAAAEVRKAYLGCDLDG